MGGAGGGRRSLALVGVRVDGSGGERVSYGQFMSFVMPTMGQGQGEQSRIVIEPLVDDRCI